MDDIIEFEKTYDYSVDVPVIDEDTWQDTGETQVISGQITFSGEAIWNSEDGEYEYDFSWRESTNSFSHDGSAPDKEDEFIQDLKIYLLEKGIPDFLIGW